jgi:hypothetical protein
MGDDASPEEDEDDDSGGTKLGIGIIIGWGLTVPMIVPVSVTSGISPGDEGFRFMEKNETTSLLNYIMMEAYDVQAPRLGLSLNIVFSLSSPNRGLSVVGGPRTTHKKDSTIRHDMRKT